MRNSIPSYIRIPVIFFIIFGIVEYFIDSGEQPAFIKYPAVMLFLLLVLLLLIGIEAIVGALENVMAQSLDKEAKARFLKEKESSNKLMTLYKKLTGNKPIEEEGEIILDHNYDGIKELDNNLPPWWIYAFYASIVFAVIYLVRFDIMDGPDQAKEYETELADANLALEEYKKTAKDLVDFETVTLLTDASDIEAGKKIFEANCVACHMADGGGGIGPNLTDQNWILGGGIKNVFKTLVEGGRDGKGMISWKSTLKPSEMQQVGSYVLSFQGTTPANPKAPEGDIWTDPDAQQPTEETTQPNTNETVTDSTSVAMN